MTLYIQVLAVLIVLAALYPEDTTKVVTYLYLKSSILFMNWIFYVYARWIHYKLSKALSGLGLQPPPFKFIPIERRTDV